MPENDIERRFMHTEVRAEEKDGSPIITGLSPVYNQRSEVLIDRGIKFIEIILPGALRDVLPVADVRGRYNHSTVLARTKSGTLELEDTPEGLRYTIHVNPNDAEAMAVYARIQRGDVDGSSFAFNVPHDGDVITRENGLRIRHIKKISSLLDVGPVDFPAYPASTTSAAVRSKLEAMDGGYITTETTSKTYSNVTDGSWKIVTTNNTRTLQQEEEPAPEDQAASSGAEDEQEADLKARQAARRRKLRLLGVPIKPTKETKGE